MEVDDKFVTHYTLYGTGFKPNEKLSFSRISGREKCNFNSSADENGFLAIGMSPAVIGKKGGESKFIII